MTKTAKPRLQCKTCPWRADVDPQNIRGGYGHVKPAKLDEMTAEGAESLSKGIAIATCHEARAERRLPCVGWLTDQLGPGNNLGLRLRVAIGRIDANVRTVGPQRDLRRELLDDEGRQA